MTELEEAKLRWREWIARHVGGPNERIDHAMVAVTKALAGRPSQAEVVEAAQKAAAEWDKSLHAAASDPASNPAQRNAGTPASLQQQWRQWIETNIGGPEGCIAISLQAAMNSLKQDRSSQKAAAAAQQAGSLWKQTFSHQDAKGAAAAVKSVSDPLADYPSLPHGIVAGSVSNLQVRQELSARFGHFIQRGTPQTPYDLVWTFRLDRRTVDGTRVPPLVIELRSPSPSAGIWGTTTKGISGSLLNGDLVAVDAHNMDPERVLVVNQLWNFTTRVLVRVRGSFRSRIFKPLFDVSVERYGSIRGRVAALQQRPDRPGHGNSQTVYSFRIQRTGPDGSVRPFLDVEMLGRRFHGAIALGDEVELNASGHKTGDVASIKKVRNLTANSVFSC